MLIAATVSAERQTRKCPGRSRRSSARRRTDNSLHILAVVGDGRPPLTGDQLLGLPPASQASCLRTTLAFPDGISKGIVAPNSPWASRVGSRPMEEAQIQAAKGPAQPVSPAFRPKPDLCNFAPGTPPRKQEDFREGCCLRRRPHHRGRGCRWVASTSSAGDAITGRGSLGVECVYSTATGSFGRRPVGNDLRASQVGDLAGCIAQR